MILRRISKGISITQRPSRLGVPVCASPSKTTLVRSALLLAAIALQFFATALHAASVDDVRLWRAPDHTRIVFDLSGPVEHRLITLDNPARIVVDISGTSLKSSMGTLELKNTPVRRVRHAVQNGSDLRVVFDLSEKVQPRSFPLKAAKGKKDRLVIDLHDMEKATQTSVKSAATLSQYRDIIVAIDAGHGGDDPGAIGPRKEREKHVVLQIAKKLAERVNREPGYSAFLIREGDYFVELKKRRDLARQGKADFFVSVHADAFTDQRARGASVYAITKGAATSATARLLARRNNESDFIGGVSTKDMDDMLTKVIADLSMTASLDTSLKVGALVLGEMAQVSRLHSKRVEQAPFAVLKSTDVPSILVETGFISNPGEARLLTSSAHQDKLAEAIFKGINAWYSRTPPPDTWLAARKNGLSPDELNRRMAASNHMHIVSRGDTLSRIAVRYKVSLAALKSHNNINGSTIRIGQKIRIPSS